MCWDVYQYIYIVRGGPEWKRPLEIQIMILNWNLKIPGLDSAGQVQDPVTDSLTKQ